MIKQHAGLAQAERKVKVKVPGKHFPALTPAEQKEFFWGTAVEAALRRRISAGCPRRRGKPIKLQAADTGALYTHLETCNPQLAKKLRARSKHSHVQETDEGELYCEFSFDESLPHHCRYVIKCFRAFDHFYETRADIGLLEYVQGFDRRATLPHNETCLCQDSGGALPLLPPPRPRRARRPVVDALLLPADDRRACRRATRVPDRRDEGCHRLALCRVDVGRLVARELPGVVHVLPRPAAPAAAAAAAQ